MASVSFVKECLEGWVRLAGDGLPRIEFFEQEHVGHDENTDSGINDLVVRIQDLPIMLDLLALLNAVEEHLRRVAGGHGTVEQCVLIEQSHQVWLAI
jgi:hypothetical protein